MAAALSIRLYHDQIFSAAMEGFLEKNRLWILKESLHQLVAQLPGTIQALRKMARGSAQASIQSAT